MKQRCIVFLRCSTDHQELESQKKETIAYAKSLGFNDFVIIGKLGASAYKVNHLYLEMIEEMKRLVETDKTIKAVVCWHLNRLARNEVKAMEIKEFLINNRMQLYVKEPHVKLLKDDGTVDDGAELVFNIFSTMSKQQAAELQAKARRGKAEKRALHKFQGGARPPFGYTMDADKNILPHPQEAPILAEIFDLYGTGQYSFSQLVSEINARYGLNLEVHSMYNFLHRKLYYDGTMYPPIITQEQFEAAERQRQNSKAKPSVYKHYTFANRLIICPVCGHGYTANEKVYLCHRFKGKRDGAPNIGTAHLDGLLWVICSHLESERLTKTDTKEKLLKEKAVLEAKIDKVGQTYTKGQKKAERAKKMALDSLITIDEYKDILAEVEDEQKETRKQVEHWRKQAADIDRLIEEDTLSMRRILQISEQITSLDEKEMRDIVRKWVQRITFEGSTYTIETQTQTYKAVYNCYGFPTKWRTVGGHFLAVRPLKRNTDGAAFQDIKLKPTDLHYTLAWLSGSQIV